MNNTVSKCKSHLYFKTIPFLRSDSWMALIGTSQNRCRPRKKRRQLRGNPLLKQDQDRSLHKRWLQFLFLFLKGNGSTLKHNDHAIKSVEECQKLSPDCCDMIEKSLEEATERSTTVTSSRECRKQKFDDASQCLLEDWMSKLAKWGGAKKRFQDCVNPNSLQSVPVPSSNSRAFRRKCYWSCVARQYTFTERIYRAPPPRWEREWIEFFVKKWIISRKEQASKEEDKRSSSLQWTRWRTYVAWEETPCDLTKPRIAPYKNTWKRLQNVVFWCSLKRAQERSAILPDTVTCSRSPQHTACSLHWGSGMCENSGWALPEVSLDSERATSRAKIELAKWQTRSTKPRRKIILGAIERFEKLRRNL